MKKIILKFIIANSLTKRGSEHQIEKLEKFFSEDFFVNTITQYDNFDDTSWNQGKGYECPNFPMFNKYMEGLESGFYMFAGESNSGKSALLLNLLMDFCIHEENKLFGIYFSLDDTCKEIIPRIIAMKEEIPITLCSKPQRFLNFVNEGHEYLEIYREWLEKREEGLEWLKTLNKKFKVVDGTIISCGEQLLQYCLNLKAYIQKFDSKMNLIVGIDALSDITFSNSNFTGANKDRQLNDHIAKEVKRWAVEILECPIFGSLHLRKIDNGKRPGLADVKDSGRYVYEASTLFLVHNDVNKNRENVRVFYREESSNFKQPIIELEWAKNKKSSFKGTTYHRFLTNYSKVVECDKQESNRCQHLAFQI